MVQFGRKGKKRKETKENKMKGLISKPSHTNLFAASNRSNLLSHATHGHWQSSEWIFSSMSPPRQALLGREIKNKTKNRFPSLFILSEFAVALLGNLVIRFDMHRSARTSLLVVVIGAPISREDTVHNTSKPISNNRPINGISNINHSCRNV